MATLPIGYLRKPGGKWRPIRLLDLAAMLYHVHRGAQTPEVGFEDAQTTLDSLTGKLNKIVFVDPALLESCLWSCNMMREKGDWWHPRGHTFDQFIQDVLRGDGFDKDYNLIVPRETK